MKPTDKLVDELAEILYYNENGMTNEDYENITGETRKLFRKPEMVFVPPEFHYWIEPHEQDEYRWQAMQVLEYMEDKKLLRPPPRPLVLSKATEEELEGLPND